MIRNHVVESCIQMNDTIGYQWIMRYFGDSLYLNEYDYKRHISLRKYIITPAQVN